MAKQAVHRNPNSRWRVIRGPYTTRAVHAQASAPLFVSVFFDAGSAAPRIGDLPLRDLHCGFGAGIGIFRANILAIGADFSSR